MALKPGPLAVPIPPIVQSGSLFSSSTSNSPPNSHSGSPPPCLSAGALTCGAAQTRSASPPPTAAAGSCAARTAAAARGCRARCRWGWCAACRQSRNSTAATERSSPHPAPADGTAVGGGDDGVELSPAEGLAVGEVLCFSPACFATFTPNSLSAPPPGAHLLGGADHRQAGGQAQRLLRARHRHIHPPVVKPVEQRARQQGLSPRQLRQPAPCRPFQQLHFFF